MYFLSLAEVFWCQTKLIGRLRLGGWL